MTKKKKTSSVAKAPSRKAHTPMNTFWVVVIAGVSFLLVWIAATTVMPFR